MTSIPSPCIGICSTVYGDTICRGCKRDYREVIAWNGYDDLQKQTILLRLQQHIEEVMAEFIEITDLTLLQTQLSRAALRPPIHTAPLCLAYELLRLKSVQLNHLDNCGIAATPLYTHLTPKALFTLIDDKLYQLSQPTIIVK